MRQDIASNKELDSDQYLRMIDLIFQAGEPYDEMQVRRRMNSGYFLTHFSQAKANLYALLSASLIRFYRQKDIALDFIERLGWVELLSQRDMSSQLDEQLSGLQELAERSGLLWMNFLVQQGQFKAAIQSGNPERLKQQIDQMAGSGSRLIRDLNLWHRVQEICLRIAHFYYTQGWVSNPDDLKELEKLYEEALELEKAESTSFEIKRYIAFFKSAYFYCRGENEILEQANVILGLDRRMSELGKATSLELAISLQRVISANNDIGYWNEVEARYLELKTITEQEQGSWLYRRELRSRLLVCLSWLRTGKITRAVASMEESGEPSFSDEDDADFRKVWFGVKCVLLLCAMRYQDLKETCLQMERDVTTDLSNTHFIVIRLSQLICAFKERDVVAFNSIYRSSVRFFEKRGVYDDSLKWFCGGLNACRREGDRGRKEMWKEFCDKVIKHPDREKLCLNKLMAFMFWAEAESRGVSVEKVFQEREFLKRWPIQFSS